LCAFDTGVTDEGPGNQFSIEAPFNLAQILESSDAAVRARVSTIHPSELNTNSGRFEISTEQRAADAPPSALPVPEPRTRIDLDVIGVLGERPNSPSRADDLQLDVKGGSVRLVMPQEAGERLRMFDRTTDGGGTTPAPADGTVEVDVAQPMGLDWREGDEVIVFVDQNDVVLSTFTDAQPDTRSAVIITLDPAGAFTVEGDMAVPNDEVTSIGPLPTQQLSAAAAALNEL